NVSCPLPTEYQATGQPFGPGSTFPEGLLLSMPIQYMSLEMVSNSNFAGGVLIGDKTPVVTTAVIMKNTSRTRLTSISGIMSTSSSSPDMEVFQANSGSTGSSA